MPVMSSYVSESGRKTTYRKKNRYIVSFWYLKQMTCALLLLCQKSALGRCHETSDSFDTFHYTHVM